MSGNARTPRHRGMQHLQWLNDSRARLLSHPALAGASSSRAAASTPSLLPRLLSDACGLPPSSLDGLPASALSDRMLLATIARSATLRDPGWVARLSRGGGVAVPRRVGAALSAPASASLATSTVAIDAALALARDAREHLDAVKRNGARRRAAATASDDERARLRSERALPREWRSLAPRAENPRRPRERPRGRPTPSACCFCPDVGHFGGVELTSDLVGPFPNARGRMTLRVHFDCACWAPQVFADPRTGRFRGVYDEHRRGRQLRCWLCHGKGATVGCYVEKCQKTFHYRCLPPAGARTVPDFFVAFCADHAHLADEPSYKLMIRASSAADVAAHRDSTDGLDAPHSRFTGLRRRDTEIIFSRTLKIASSPAVYNTDMVLFSSARRRVMQTGAPLRLADRCRLLRYSALEVASGSLALRAVGQTAPAPQSTEDVCATKALAAIASPESSGLFLLRNLVGAPRWTPETISLARPPAKRSVHFNQRVRASKSGTPIAPADDVDSGASPPPSPRVTRSGRSRRASKGAPPPGDVSAAPSARLPPRRRPDARAHASPSTSPLAPRARAPEKPAAPAAPARGSAWDEFLSEQLPRERAVRPEDDMDEAMQNMARMWSLLTLAERAGYEARASGRSARTPARTTARPSASVSAPASGWSEPLVAGLFAPKRPPASPPAGSRPTKRPRSTREQAKSVGLPRRQGRRGGREGEVQENAEPNWDEMFPLSLDPDDVPTGPVKPPPTRRRRRS